MTRKWYYKTKSLNNSMTKKYLKILISMKKNENGVPVNHNRNR